MIFVEIETLDTPSKYSKAQIALAMGVARLVVLGVSEKHNKLILCQPARFARADAQ